MRNWFFTPFQSEKAVSAIIMSESGDVNIPWSRAMTLPWASAMARANKWIVAPAGDAALNTLGLDTQVPARHVYVSSGPYKTYSYGPYTIELRHRANRDLLSCSPITRIVVQALKALGKDNVDSETVSTLAHSLSSEDAETLLRESKGITSWVAETAKRIWEERSDG